MGTLGYGCLATSLVFNQKASDTYSKYLSGDTPYSEYEQQNQLFSILLYSAIGIWATDIFILSVRTKKHNELNRNKNISFNPFFNPYTKNGLVTLKYNF